MKLNKKTLMEDNITIDPTQASKAEILDTIENSIVSDDPKAELTKAQKEKAVDSIIKASDDFDAEMAKITEDDILETTNDITSALDKCLRLSEKERRYLDKDAAILNRKPARSKNNHNLLIIGLPGSGKTAIVKDWARRNNVNIMYVDAKSNDLEAYLNGYTLRGKDNEDGSPSTEQAYSKTLDKLDRPRSVLFLDEYNRQLDGGIRASLLSLIQEHVVSGKDEDGYRYFPNMLFTIALCNPVTDYDRNIAELDTAEKSRFTKIRKYDSNIADARNYFENYYYNQLKNLVNRYQDKNDSDYKDRFFENARSYEMLLGTGIRSDYGILNFESFDFDQDTPEMHRQLHKENAKMLNQRALTDGLGEAEGKIDELMTWVKNDSQFMQANIDIILDALKDVKRHKMSNNDLLDLWEYKFKNYKGAHPVRVEFDKIQLGYTGSKTSTFNPSTPKLEIEIEKDADLFTSKDKTNKRDALTADELKNRISDLDLDL